MNEFKMIAELSCDVETFKGAVKAQQIPVSDIVLSDELGMKQNGVKFSSTLTLKEIIKTLKTLEDCHRMSQTVQPIELFTGDVDWDR